MDIPLIADTRLIALAILVAVIIVIPTVVTFFVMRGREFKRTLGIAQRIASQQGWVSVPTLVKLGKIHKPVATRVMRRACRKRLFEEAKQGRFYPRRPDGSVSKPQAAS
jgi:hypothetical protein